MTLKGCLIQFGDMTAKAPVTAVRYGTVKELRGFNADILVLERAPVGGEEEAEAEQMRECLAHSLIRQVFIADRG